jgi:Rieske Fe-S protein
MMVGGAAAICSAALGGCSPRRSSRKPACGTLEIPREQPISVGSVTRVADQIFVIRDRLGIYALSAICTHQACVLVFEDGELLCDCHYATFDLFGAVTNGPAEKPLAHYPITRNPSGQLVVTLCEAPPTARLPVPESAP